MWRWDEVFEYLVHMCGEHGGYYQLSIEEGAQFKDGPIKRGWGEANLHQNVLPRYRRRYPEYEFGVTSDRKYLWCKRRAAKPFTSRPVRALEEGKITLVIGEPSEEAYACAVNALRNIEPQSPFVFGKWKGISEDDIRKIGILRICSSQTRVANLRSLEYSSDLNKLKNETPEEEVLAVLRKHGIRFPSRKAKWISHLFSLDIVSLIQNMEELSGASLSQERKARERVRTAIRGMGLKTVSDFLKDIGFSKYLAVLDSRNLRFLQTMGLAPKQLKANELSKRKVYYKLEDIENELAKKMGITVSELDERIMAYTGEERPHRI